MAHQYESEVVIGEVVESESTLFTAQCIEVPAPQSGRMIDPPPFGSFVKLIRESSQQDSVERIRIDEPDPFAATSLPMPRLQPGLLLAIVTRSKMSMLDSSRRAVALGYESRDELMRRQPQIAELTATEFSGLLIGHSDNDGRLRLGIPPRPARLHDRVYSCTTDEIVPATDRLSYLRRILDGVSGPDSDELCAAVVRTGWHARAQSPNYMRSAGTELAGALLGDYGRLERIIQAVIG